MAPNPTGLFPATTVPAVTVDSPTTDINSSLHQTGMGGGETVSYITGNQVSWPPTPAKKPVDNSYYRRTFGLRKRGHK